MNKKLIMGLTIGLCIVPVLALIITIVLHSRPEQIIEDQSSQISIELEESYEQENSEYLDEEISIEESIITDILEESIEESYDLIEEEIIDSKEDIDSEITDHSLFQHEEEFAPYSEEELALIGDKHVLNDKNWLNEIYTSVNAYRNKYHISDIDSISIYYLEDCRLAYFIFHTVEDKTFIIRNYTDVSKYSIRVEYGREFRKFEDNEITELGFKIIKYIDETNYPRILEFFNDTGEFNFVYISSSTIYKDLNGLTINDL